MSTMNVHASCILLAALSAGHVCAQTPRADAFDEDGIPVVITPTRLRQSLADVPASVTVITSDMLR
ncbi:hypothetical protein CLD22_29630, partial [Rubrivivax gelatinosus]|nr:hypothetical protein [Rubrivivax gelatinosus]